MRARTCPPARPRAAAGRGCRRAPRGQAAARPGGPHDGHRAVRQWRDRQHPFATDLGRTGPRPSPRRPWSPSAVGTARARERRAVPGRADVATDQTDPVLDLLDDPAGDRGRRPPPARRTEHRRQEGDGRRGIDCRADGGGGARCASPPVGGGWRERFAPAVLEQRRDRGARVAGDVEQRLWVDPEGDREQRAHDGDDEDLGLAPAVALAQGVVVEVRRDDRRLRPPRGAGSRPAARSSSSASGEPPAITGRARASGAGASEGERIQTAATTRR